MLVPEFTRKKDYIMWHLAVFHASCFCKQDFRFRNAGFQCVISEDLFGIWGPGTGKSVPCIYDRLSCFSQFSRIFLVAASLQNKGRPGEIPRNSHASLRFLNTELGEQGAKKTLVAWVMLGMI